MPRVARPAACAASDLGSPGEASRWTGSGLRPYQVAGIRWLKSLPEGRGILGDHPGLGKSAQALLAAEGQTLVLAPAMVLDAGVWADEAERWRPDLDVTTCSYSSLTARERTEKGGTRPVGRPRREFADRWDTVILDEAHYIKGRKTTWTEAVERLRFDRAYLLSGTPIPNWAHELFIPLRLTHPSQAGGGQAYGSFWRWAKRWFDVTPSRWNPRAFEIGRLLACQPECKDLRGPTGERAACEHWAEFHEANLGGVFLQRLRDDVLTDLPPLVEQEVACRMGPAQKRLYEELKKDFIAWTESGVEVKSWTKSALAVKLAQVCTGVEVVDPESRGSAKLDALVERVEGQAQPSLVVAHFRAACRAAGEACRRAGKAVAVITGESGPVERRAAVQAFQRGDLDVLVGSLDTISEGLTLHRADTVHFLEHSWRPSRNEQALRRIHRIGQVRPVTAYHYRTTGTVDARIKRLLESKSDQAMMALRPRDLAALL